MSGFRLFLMAAIAVTTAACHDAQQASRSETAASVAAVAPATAAVVFQSESAAAKADSVKIASAAPDALAAYILQISSPLDRSTVSGQWTIRGTAAGFENVEISRGGLLLARATPDAAGAFEVTLDTRILAEGVTTLTFNSWDSPAGTPFTRTSQVNVTVNVVPGISIVDYGAVADGVTDNLAAINLAVVAAQSSGAAVLVPAGTFAYGGVIKLIGVQLLGVGDSSVLYDLDYSNESIFMYGAGPQVRSLKLTGVQSPTRMSAWENTRITVFGATLFTIDHVTIDGSAAAGIQTARAAANGSITNNVISNTLSDSIHITDRASNIQVINNHIENSGDDGIAVVSYQHDGDYVTDIVARDNVVLNNKGGRNMSVVGGMNITYENNYLEGNPSVACMYLAQEWSYNTFGIHFVRVANNTFKSCGSRATGHAAVMLFSDGYEANTDVSLLNNAIVQDGLTGIRVFGPNEAIVIDGNSITGADPDYDIQTAGITVVPYVSGLVGYLAPQLDQLKDRDGSQRNP